MIKQESFGAIEGHRHHLFQQSMRATMLGISFFFITLLLVACTNLQAQSDQRITEIGELLNVADKAIDLDAKLAALKQAERLMQTATADLPGTPVAEAIVKDQAIAGKTLGEVRTMVWNAESKAKFLKCGRKLDSICVAELLGRTVIDAWNSHAFDSPDIDRSDLSSAEGLLYDYLNSIGKKVDAKIYIKHQDKAKVDALYPEWSGVSGLELFELMTDEHEKGRQNLYPDLILAALARQGNYNQINEILVNKRFSRFIGAGSLSGLIRSKSFDMTKISPEAKIESLKRIQERVSSFDVYIKSFEVTDLAYVLTAFGAENVVIDLANRLDKDWRNALSNKISPLHIFNMTEAGIAIALLYNDIQMNEKSASTTQYLFKRLMAKKAKDQLSTFSIYCQYLCKHLSFDQLKWLYTNTSPEDGFGKSEILCTGLMSENIEFWREKTIEFIRNNKREGAGSEYAITMKLTKYNLAPQFSDILRGNLVTHFRVIFDYFDKISDLETQYYFSAIGDSPNIRTRLVTMSDYLRSLELKFIRK